MSSVSEDTSKLKAGHPPAVKAGGMRITQHKVAHEKPEPKVESNDECKDGDSLIKILTSISGATILDDQDFPASSVKAFHEKTPLPTNDFRPINRNHIIQQPKK